MLINKITISFLLSLCLLSNASAQSLQQSAIEVKKPSFVVIGRDFFKLPEKMVTSARKNEIEVIYFFWYGSPQSAEIDRQIRTWAVSQPYSIKLTPAPASFDPLYGMFSARIFFALEFLGKEKTISPLFLEAITKNHVSMENPLEVLEWMESHGVPKRKFQNAINHSVVIAKAASVNSVMNKYKIQNTPSVVIDGQYLVPSRTGQSPQQWLANTKFITEKAFEEKKLKK